MMRQLLETDGYPVIEAKNGREAVKIAHGEKPDLILMDVNLPSVNGFKATKQIKHEAGTQHIPVVLMSEHCWSFDWRSKAQDLECEECVDKRVDFGAVQAVIKRFMLKA